MFFPAQGSVPAATMTCLFKSYFKMAWAEFSKPPGLLLTCHVNLRQGEPQQPGRAVATLSVPEPSFSHDRFGANQREGPCLCCHAVAWPCLGQGKTSRKDKVVRLKAAANQTLSTKLETVRSRACATQGAAAGGVLLGILQAGATVRMEPQLREAGEGRHGF